MNNIIQQYHFSIAVDLSWKLRISKFSSKFSCKLGTENILMIHALITRSFFIDHRTKRCDFMCECFFFIKLIRNNVADQNTYIFVIPSIEMKFNYEKRHWWDLDPRNFYDIIYHPMKFFFGKLNFLNKFKNYFLKHKT